MLVNSQTPIAMRGVRTACLMASVSVGLTTTPSSLEASPRRSSLTVTISGRVSRGQHDVWSTALCHPSVNLRLAVRFQLEGCCQA